MGLRRFLSGWLAATGLGLSAGLLLSGVHLVTVEKVMLKAVTYSFPQSFHEDPDFVPGAMTDPDWQDTVDKHRTGTEVAACYRSILPDVVAPHCLSDASRQVPGIILRLMLLAAMLYPLEVGLSGWRRRGFGN